MTTTIDNFITNRKIDIIIEGLGALEFLLEPLTEAIVNLVREDIANLLETEIKQLLQYVLGETPWPALKHLYPATFQIGQ